MSDTLFSQVVCDRLGILLKKLPRTHRVRSVRGLFAATRKPLRRFLIGQAGRPVLFRVAEHFDVEVNAAVNDNLLGCLGLIHFVPSGNLDQTWVRQRIDQAAYLRHLMLEDVRPGTPQARKSPYTVEVVFAISRASDADGA